MPLSSDPEGKRLPIKLDSTSNGEFMPIPLYAANRRANQLAQRSASENARRRGVDRRAFMVSACGAASTLLAFNAANAASGRTGGFFELEQVAAVDPGVRVAPPTRRTMGLTWKFQSSTVCRSADWRERKPRSS